ncbi:Piso0_004125 [Millerozyma farinosa CBS 7064]|uniref:Piso0_004125 protein n=1 Tax=Pichia sorbitophila (strain ATCC MYA-4447 / BCRC 22081 / CBS 7064 / NBRC 10061 / NRRL Y-12695) TaxID=559304 RepID=G8YAG3_PICSO|nr:Piso0_004125 [Millerozyma farinosa CBS 7064]CCE84577.1 Piso0_004125 [Millerozyma farinosa CBS 7064]
MRSLPPPRITRKRRWRRIKRAIKAFFTKGYISDPGAFLSSSKGSKGSISTIRKSRFSPRYRKARLANPDMTLREGANVGIATASLVSKVASRASMPLLRPLRDRSNRMNFTVRF